MTRAKSILEKLYYSKYSHNAKIDYSSQCIEDAMKQVVIEFADYVDSYFADIHAPDVTTEWLYDKWKEETK